MWSNQAPPSKALFEKIKVVGKGAYGAAVLYRKKDDDSLVVLKEVNLLDLTKAERTLALNEVLVEMTDTVYSGIYSWPKIFVDFAVFILTLNLNQQTFLFVGLV